MISLVLCCAVSYLLGSIPNGLIIGKVIWGIDLREYGSKNIGATNAWSTIGKAAGLSIFLLDFLKGFISAYIGVNVAGTELAGVICGMMAIVGHSWSLFMSFKGGKSVATGLGVIAMLMPVVTVVVFAVWFVIVYVTRYVSLGSIVAAIIVPVLAYVLDYSSEYILFGVLTSAFVTYRHKSNIIRLMSGTENKIKAGKLK